MLRGTQGLVVGPEQEERFLQAPGAHQRRVPGDQLGRPLPL